MIKNILYLDEQKMYSLSSQIFEGITEYVINENVSGKEDTEQQKGPVGSGKVLGDVIRSSIKNTEKKFFHDYSYSIFENHLISDCKVFEVICFENTQETISEGINKFSFIKIKGRAIFSDVEKINELFANYNTIGEALTHVTNFEALNQAEGEMTEVKKNKSDRNTKARLNIEIKRLTNLKSLAKESGLYQDEKFLSNLSLLTKYGFSNQFEIRQNGGDVLFTSCLKRECLRESEELLVKKYSRKTEKEIVVFGLISQAFSQNKPEIDKNQDFPNMKAALMNLIEHLSNIENSISGKQENEIIIDPIAVYVEV